MSIAAFDMTRLLFRHRRVLVATSRVELAKRYAGSLLGAAWIVAFPLLFLAVYLFVFTVVFPRKFDDASFGKLDFVVYIFSGLVPYLAFMEALNTGVVSIRQNIHLIKNVILPIELIPARAVAISLVSQSVGLALLLLLAAFNGSLTAHLALLPVAMAVQLLFLLGLVWILSAVGVLFPDAGQFVSLIVFLLAFLSPIAFRPEDLGSYGFVVSLNPVTYMMAPYRMSILAGEGTSWLAVAVAFAGSLVVFGLGCAFFRRFKNVLVDYE